MTRLVLEATPSVTRIEVMDWLCSQGFTTYDVTPMLDGVAENGNSIRFGFTTNDSSARRALTILPGRSIGRSVITIRLENPD